ncbi:protein phosphatase 2C [Cryptosporidium andersoni]|uniref:Protein phosphatase 2C n=1 Tax=Cryptosporidium andersoni TaxID=117008 RepID=A0A1J4MEW4_9CRYT|nr:protein phosphatase 2C [Cryptosporidium andersoni]
MNSSDCYIGSTDAKLLRPPMTSILSKSEYNIGSTPLINNSTTYYDTQNISVQRFFTNENFARDQHLGKHQAMVPPQPTSTSLFQSVNLNKWPFIPQNSDPILNLPVQNTANMITPMNMQPKVPQRFSSYTDSYTANSQVQPQLMMQYPYNISYLGQMSSGSSLGGYPMFQRNPYTANNQTYPFTNTSHNHINTVNLFPNMIQIPRNPQMSGLQPQVSQLSTSIPKQTSRFTQTSHTLNDNISTNYTTYLPFTDDNTLMDISFNNLHKNDRVIDFVRNITDNSCQISDRIDVSLKYNEVTRPKTGGATIKGFKPTLSIDNQDRAILMEYGPRASAYAVFDGHGPQGDIIAEYVCNHFTSALNQLLNPYKFATCQQMEPPTRQQMRNYFSVLFHNMDTEISEFHSGISLWSGCTAALCVRLDRDIHIAWAGDSRVVLYRMYASKPETISTDDNSLNISWWTTSDHIPNRPDELARIHQFGASVVVYPTPWLNKSTTRIREHGIAMSRSFGDKAGSQYGVICIPDMATISLDMCAKKEPAYGIDKWIVVAASDGIWDSLSEEEVGYHIWQNLVLRKDVSNQSILTDDDVWKVSHDIAKEAWIFRATVENYSDDTTIIISVL